MRLLFYTAIIAFLALAGIFTFFALQPSDPNGAPRVVLSIDSSDRSPSRADTPGNERTAFVEPAAEVLQEQGAETAPAEIISDTSRLQDESLPADAETITPSESIASDEQIPEENVAEPETLTAENESVSEPVAEPLVTLPSQDESLPAEVYGTHAETITPSESIASDEQIPDENAAEPETLTAKDESVSEPVAEPLATLPYILPGTAFANLEDGGSTDSESPGADLSPGNQPEESAQAPEQTIIALSLPKAQEADQISSGAEESVSQTPETSVPQAASEPIETIKSEPSSAAEDAVKSEDETKLQAGFDTSLVAKEQQPADIDPVAALATEIAPPLPPQRPKNIPAPIKTAANSWAGQQFSLTDAPPVNSPRIALVLRGLGRDDRNSEEAVTKLPPAISMAFMPYIGPAQRWSRKARELGHEVIIQLPLEPSNYPANNPGPETLVTSVGADENISRLRIVLGRFENYNGVTNFLGERLLQSQDALRPILENLKSQGLIYVGEANSSHAVVRRLAGEIGLRYGGADIVIDAQPTPDAIKKALDQLVALARKNGSAIGIGYASRTTIKQVEAWSKTVNRAGVTLVPVGALAQTPGAS